MALKTFGDFKEISERAEQGLRQISEEIYQNGKKALAGNIMSSAEDLIELNTLENFTEIKEIIDQLVESKISDYVLECGGGSSNLMTIKKDITQKLELLSGEFFSKLVDTESKTGKAIRIFGVKKSHIVLALGFNFRIRVPSILFAPIENLKLRGEESDFKGNYHENPEKWRGEYARKRFDVAFTKNFILEKVEALLFCPNYYIENLKRSIQFVIESQEKVIKDLEEENRSQANLKSVLEPLRKTCSHLTSAITTIEDTKAQTKAAAIHKKIEEEKEEE
jgi:hypothetical protein